MVSVHPNPPTGQGFTRFYNSHFGGNAMSSPATKTTEDNVLPRTASYLSAGPGVEDPSKKARKPYTITKSRESWTEMEHDKFVEALHLFDRDWKKIEAFVGSKTVIQIRSHAQKHFMKVQKNGISEHVPPPRPKRKAAHPYPHKAPKKEAVASQPLGSFSSPALLNSKYAVGPQSMSVPRSIISSEPLNWACTVPPACISPISWDDLELSDGTMKHNGSSNSDEVASHLNSQAKEKLIGERVSQPDFAQIYSFIGSLFDPSSSEHLEKLKYMDPINIETVMLLIKNLSVNLVSPECENHRNLLSSYNVDTHKDSTTAL